MSGLIRWDPFGDLVTLRDAMDRLFDDSLVSSSAGWAAPLTAAKFAVDMFETKDDVVVKAALPGVKPEEVEVTITGNVLKIHGETNEEKESQEGDYVRKERRSGSLSRSVTLPGGLKTEKADASFEDGVLTLRIPKTEESKPKSIKVKTK